MDLIEAARLCQRQQDLEDKRSCLLELTTEGRVRFSEATRTFTEELEIRIGAMVSQRTLTQFAATIRRLHKGL